MEDYLNKLLDDRNRQLWEKLSAQFNIELRESQEPNYMTLVEGSNAVIWINSQDIHPAPFTHELLHIEIKARTILIADELTNTIKQNEQLAFLISPRLREHIGNCLEHKIMLGIYLKMGFEPRLFISDYHEKKMTNSLMHALENKYNVGGIYNREAVDFYIGKFFAMKACNNVAYNYSKYHAAFRKIDQRMFQLLSDFWSDWDTFDVDNPEDTYEDILENFISDLSLWVKNKTIQ